jgi:hypothetical protein
MKTMKTSISIVGVLAKIQTTHVRSIIVQANLLSRMCGVLPLLPLEQGQLYLCKNNGWHSSFNSWNFVEVLQRIKQTCKGKKVLSYKYCNSAEENR